MTSEKTNEHVLVHAVLERRHVRTSKACCALNHFELFPERTEVLDNYISSDLYICSLLNRGAGNRGGGRGGVIMPLLVFEIKLHFQIYLILGGKNCKIYSSQAA